MNYVVDKVKGEKKEDVSILTHPHKIKSLYFLIIFFELRIVVSYLNICNYISQPIAEAPKTAAAASSSELTRNFTLSL